MKLDLKKIKQEFCNKIFRNELFFSISLFYYVKYDNIINI